MVLLQYIRGGWRETLSLLASFLTGRLLFSKNNRRSQFLNLHLAKWARTLFWMKLLPNNSSCLSPLLVRLNRSIHSKIWTVFKILFPVRARLSLSRIVTPLNWSPLKPWVVVNQKFSTATRKKCRTLPWLSRSKSPFSTGAAITLHQNAANNNSVDFKRTLSRCKLWERGTLERSYRATINLIS